MSRYIDAEAAIQYIEETTDADEWLLNQYNADWISTFLETRPTADVEEVRHGKPKLNKGDSAKRYYCPFCYEYLKSETHYCPNCGAKMDGGKE